MTVSILLVVSLTAFCLYRILREKAPSDRMAQVDNTTEAQRHREEVQGGAEPPTGRGTRVP